MRRWDEGLWIFAVVMMAGTAGTVGQTGGPQNSATAQVESAPPKLPVYDVVSIKLNNSGGNGVEIHGRPDYYSAKNIPLKQLLANAYDLREDLISGVTGPIESARFDVTAKIVEPDLDALKKFTPKQRQSMLQPFLIERFHLKAHVEIKTLPVYELTVVPGGPKFKQTAADDKQSPHTDMYGGKGTTELSAGGLSMATFAKILTGQVNRTVIDKTGLAGGYELALKWSRDDNPDESSEVPSIFTALQEQLGLKLQPAKGPVETLAVDHVEMPSEN